MHCALSVSLSVIGLLFVAVHLPCQDDKPKVVKRVKGAYLGQKPPGLVPVNFGPGQLSTSVRELNCSSTPDGNEVFFATRRNGRYTLLTMKRVREVWTKRAVSLFSGTYADVDPFVSLDGKCLYFSSKRRLERGGRSGDSNIW